MGEAPRAVDEAQPPVWWTVGGWVLEGLGAVVLALLALRSLIANGWHAETGDVTLIAGVMILVIMPVLGPKIQKLGPLELYESAKAERVKAQEAADAAAFYYAFSSTAQVAAASLVPYIEPTTWLHPSFFANVLWHRGGREAGLTIDEMNDALVEQLGPVRYTEPKAILKAAAYFLRDMAGVGFVEVGADSDGAHRYRIGARYAECFSFVAAAEMPPPGRFATLGELLDDGSRAEEEAGEEGDDADEDEGQE